MVLGSISDRLTLNEEIIDRIGLVGSKMKSGVGSSRSNASSVTASTLTEHDYIGLSEVSSSSHTSEYTNTNNNNNSSHIHEKQSQESNGSLGDAELNLGLSLSYKKDNNGVATGFSGSEKAFQKWVSQEEYQRHRNPNGTQQGVWGRAGFEHRTSQEKGASCSSVWQGGQVLRSWEGTRILTAEDLHAAAAALPPPPCHTPVVQDVAERGRTGYVFSNSGRVIMPPPAAAPAAIAGTKRIHNESDGSDGLQDGSETSKGQAAVGWPPIGTYRSKTRATAQPRSPLYVKVNMDGVPIGRKVDLNAHESYETLAQALEDMFQRPNNANGQSGTQTQMEKGHVGANDIKHSRLLDSSSDFALTYEDKEGDWMLVGDVPWRMFVNTVKRLRIMKTSDANGLAPRCPEKIDRQKNKTV